MHHIIGNVNVGAPYTAIFGYILMFDLILLHFTLYFLQEQLSQHYCAKIRVVYHGTLPAAFGFHRDINKPIPPTLPEVDASSRGMRWQRLAVRP